MRCAPPASVWTTTVMRETPGVSLWPTASEMDVESAPPEQRRDAVQDARPILDVHGEGMHGHDVISQTSAPVSTIGFGRRIIA